MLVLDAIADHDDLALADREVVEVGARVELDLVADDRGRALAGRRRGGGDGQHRAVVDVGVVGEHVDQDRPHSRSVAAVSGLATGPSLVPVTVTVTVEEAVAPCSSSMS